MLGRTWFLFPGVLLLGAVSLQQPLLLLAALLVVLASLMARGWARYAFERLDYQRHLSAGRVFFGENITLEKRITNAKMLPLPWLRIQDEVPDELTYVRQPTTAAPRAGRAYITSVLSLGLYHRITRRYTVECTKRGLFVFGPTLLKSGDLFGFFQRETLAEAQERLLVYPRILPLEELGIVSRTPFGDRRVRRHLFEDPVRVVSTREYAAGDPLRRINWKASARVQRLQTRVYEPTTSVDLALFLDVRTVEPPIWGKVEQLLETAVIAAASITDHAIHNGVRVGLYVNEPYLFRDGLIRMPPSDQPEQLQHALEALAQVQGLPALPIEEVLNREARGVHGSATLAVLTARPTEALTATLVRFRRAGRRVAMVQIGDEAVPTDLRGVPLFGVPADVYWHTLESVRMGAVRP